MLKVFTASQTWPHSPQLSWSVSVSVSHPFDATPSQSARESARGKEHPATQAPPWQTRSLPHTLSQLPQCAASVDV